MRDSARACVYVCVCVCACERERERERESTCLRVSVCVRLSTRLLVRLSTRLLVRASVAGQFLFCFVLMTILFIHFQFTIQVCLY